MKTIKIILYILIQLTFISQLSGQINGKVFEITTNNDTLPLIGANVYYPNTSIGTITDKVGKFILDELKDNHTLVISFIGYKNDTINISKRSKNLNIILQSGTNLDEVVISKRVEGTYISALKPIKTEVISSNGLEKLACCNLSESFENSATIDVSYSDAISGAKQIKMLGLDGKYAQILNENIPLIRGLSLIYGLNQVPGSWLESIQISKGTSSVINGYESTSGQINLELKKPEETKPLFVNLYTNSDQKLEGNLISSIRLNNKWSTMLLTHGSFISNSMDNNNDSFVDIPHTNLVSVMNRWKFQSQNLKSQFGFGFLQDNGLGGQVNFVNTNNNNQFYGIDREIKNYQFFGKTGYSFERPSTSLGVIVGYNQMNMNSIFGQKNYTGNQEYFYTNVIFNTYLFNTSHLIATGMSYVFDVYDERYIAADFNRKESIPGIFGQYTYLSSDNFTFIAGMRVDDNSYFGLLFTPRIHVKYNINEKSTIRGSVGKGYRSSNVFTENLSTLASSRNVFIDIKLDIENAWNYGVNFTQDILLKDKKISALTLDFYRTNFMNQVIADMEQSPQDIHFYNLNGKSFSNSFQVQMTLNIIRNIEFLLAYRLNDVKVTVNNELINKPFVNKHKGLLNISYTTKYDKWQVDFTGQYNGHKQLPSTLSNPEEYRYPESSPSYYIIHMQTTRRFRKLEVYSGIENLTDFKQENSIISSHDPFSDYFDASMVWGPITGRMFYAGLRYNLNN
ncbi:TonB-dependent receptor domain-containing protein [Bacteroidota bacterium]